MASPKLKRASFLLATLLVAGCNGLADLGGACDGGRRSAGGGTSGAGGMAGEAGADAAVGSSGGAPLDASSAGGAPGGGDASSGSGGASGDATTDGDAAGGASSGGTTAAGGASSGGVAPDASTSSGGTAGAGGTTSAACSNGVKDGDETDVDCGGACEPCGLNHRCVQSSDCSATAAGCDVTLGGCACDALSHVCVASHCMDHSRDATESDVDCGGLCDGCGPGEACHADTDCSLYASGCDRCMCDQDTSTCVHDHCVDHNADVDETDVDCGGSRCSQCPNGDCCRVDADCVSNACDLATLLCITDQCADHRKDGAESDADCGGGVCGVCLPGQHCFSNFDCVPGHFCNGGRLCQ